MQKNEGALNSNTLVNSEPEDIFDDVSVNGVDSNNINNNPKPILENIRDLTIHGPANEDKEKTEPLESPITILHESSVNGVIPDSPSDPSDINNIHPNGSGVHFSDDSTSLEEEIEQSEVPVEGKNQNESGDRVPSTPLGDLTRSLSPKYFIQIVRISVNEPLNGSGMDATTAIGNAPAHKILYTIKSQKKSGRNEVFLVNRFHEDVEWLDHCLLTQNKALGLIIPPLPNKPIESFYLCSTNEGSDDSTSADQSLIKSPYDKSILEHIHHSFNYDCFNFERYLTLLLQHPVFGSDITLKRFLTEKNAPPHGKFKKGFLDKLTSAVSDMRKVNQSEFDEFFQHERFWNTEYSGLLRDTLQASHLLTYVFYVVGLDGVQSFSKKVEALYQLAQVNGHFSTALSMAHCTGPSIYLSFNQTLQNISILFENLKQKYEELQAYYQLTLGFELDFYCRYLESHKDTLNRRNCLLLEYENCNKAHERAKQNKKEMARQVKSMAAKTLDECSEVAKKEFTRFHADQSAQILKSVYNYANANLQKSKDIYDLIASALDDLKTVI